MNEFGRGHLTDVMSKVEPLSGCVSKLKARKKVMPHAFGKKKKGNMPFARLKRVQVATHIASELGGAQYQLKPKGELYHIHMTTLAGLTLLVSVRASRVKTKTPNKFKGFDLYCLHKAVVDFQHGNPGAPVKAVSVMVKGSFIDIHVHEEFPRVDLP
jgi:hypothetical protein